MNVQNVFYRDVTVSNSDAGIMIKSYPDNVGIFGPSNVMLTLPRSAS